MGCVASCRAEGCEGFNDGGFFVGRQLGFVHGVGKRKRGDIVGLHILRVIRTVHYTDIRTTIYQKRHFRTIVRWQATSSVTPYYSI